MCLMARLNIVTDIQGMNQILIGICIVLMFSVSSSICAFFFYLYPVNCERLSRQTDISDYENHVVT